MGCSPIFENVGVDGDWNYHGLLLDAVHPSNMGILMGHVHCNPVHRFFARKHAFFGNEGVSGDFEPKEDGTGCRV
jgi:hypothetical protein